MKFRVSFKTPDALPFAISELVQIGVKKDKIANAEKLAEQYIKYGEYITIEFDTEKQTATVIKV